MPHQRHSPTEPLSDFDLRRMVERIFGETDDPITLLEQRADLVTRFRLLVWEGDATTFQFRYVSPSAEEILGYPAERWMTEAGFWADVVVHPDDRDDAVAFCALATGQGRPHDFIYRARHADGHILYLHDFVRVVPGRYDLPEFLQGVMIDVSADFIPDEKHSGLHFMNPSLETLRARSL